ncbi:uncharacterized protein LOC124410227 [Diprion similis]|uniref:uncharacterized protein LOC124410227 n=1 Tax=Diprion similis TaxID=362088 RepID=UPI001EF7B6A5|nr:uncharacterized protein LOC124410227 [Diprion similis]
MIYVYDTIFGTTYDSKNMRWCLAILFFGLSSTACLGQKCEPTYGVDFELLTSAYAAGAEQFPTPTIELNDRSACKFGMKYTNDVTAYIESLFLNVYLQADQTGNQLIKAVKDRSNVLRRAILSIGNMKQTEIGIEEGLKSLIGQINLFLNLLPGNVDIKFAALPDLPKEPVNGPLSINKELSAADYFLHWAETADSVFVRLYGYITGMFLSGWSNARLYFNLVGTQIRNQVLNSIALKNYKFAVAEVLSEADLFQRHCTNETWGSFQDVAFKVAALSHHLHEALENYNACLA